MWTMVIIILVIAMAVGPVMLLRPSATDQRLATLRQHAAQLGLRVTSSHMAERCCLYARAHKEQGTYDAPPLVLVRKQYHHGLHVAGVWAIESGQVPAHSKTLTASLEQLPSSVMGVEINTHCVSVHWQEKGGIATLETLNRILVNWPVNS